MKKWFIVLLTLVIFCSPIFLGGCSVLNGKSEKEELIEIAESKKMKQALEDLLREIDPKALTPEGKIKSYEIQEDKLKYNPMGGLIVHLTINGDEKLDIGMTVQENATTGEYEIGGYGMSPDFDELIRGE